MDEFTFEIRLRFGTPFDDDLIVALHDARCGDAKVVHRRGRTTLTLRRKAKSEAEAVLAVLIDLGRVGLAVAGG